MTRKILLADDGPAIRQVVALTFLDRDYEIVSVDNGDEALAVLHQSKPDLVLADVHMPGASGYEVCRQTKMVAGDVPVLLLVGNLEPFSEAAARECGSDGMLRKPFDSKELLQRVDELMALADARSEPVQGEDSVHVDGGADATDAERAAAERTQPMQKLDPDAQQTGPSNVALSDADVDRIARRVLELMPKAAFEKLAWDVVPDMAEVVVRDRLKELEAQLDDLS